MKKLFEPIKIKGMELTNRFVKSATWMGMATDEGNVSGKLIKAMGAWAKGGVGLVISGQAYILPLGKGAPKQLGIDRDELIPGLQELTKAVHENGSKVAVQLNHAGNSTFKMLTGQTPVVVSNFEGVSGEPREELTSGDIEELIKAFTQAARRAKEAGFDCIQIHSAHGYLLNQFLSPRFNRRQDSYGGAIENRARIHLKILKAIRNVVGEDFPVIMKLNGVDGTDDGLILEASVQVGKLMAEAGLDAIEVSGGPIPMLPNISSEDKEAYYSPMSKTFKDALDIPVMLIGGIRSLNVAERLLEDRAADMIFFSRPLIREPALINRWKAGDESKAKCISCNGCVKAGMEGNGVYCVVEAKKK